MQKLDKPLGVTVKLLLVTKEFILLLYKSYPKQERRLLWWSILKALNSQTLAAKLFPLPLGWKKVLLPSKFHCGSSMKGNTFTMFMKRKKYLFPCWLRNSRWENEEIYEDWSVRVFSFPHKVSLLELKGFSVQTWQ